MPFRFATTAILLGAIVCSAFDRALAAESSAAAAPAVPVASAVATVPVGVKIPVELTEQVTSLAAHVGDAFTYKTVEDETLGGVVVPAGTLGRGRVAAVAPAHDRTIGSLSLAADRLDLADGRTIAVNIDASRPIRGHLSDRHTRFLVIPIPIGLVPISRTTRSGNLVLEPGTTFTVVTAPPRVAP